MFVAAVRRPVEGAAMYMGTSDVLSPANSGGALVKDEPGKGAAEPYWSLPTVGKSSVGARACGTDRRFRWRRDED